MAVTWHQLELPLDDVDHLGARDGDAALPDACRGDRSPMGTFADCPLCGGDLAPEHAHFRCATCGWRDSCCD